MLSPAATLRAPLRYPALTMPTAYQFWLFVHILGVFALAGAATTFIVCLSMMRRAKTAQELRPWADVAFAVEKAVTVAGLVVLGTGIYMASDHDLWELGWVNWSSTALVLGILLWVVVNTRKSAAIRRAARDAADGPVPDVLAAQVTDPILFGATHAVTTVVLGIIWNMTTKPGDTQALIVLIVAALVGAASAAPMVARQQRAFERAGR